MRKFDWQQDTLTASAGDTNSSINAGAEWILMNLRSSESVAKLALNKQLSQPALFHFRFVFIISFVEH